MKKISIACLICSVLFACNSTKKNSSANPAYNMVYTYSDGNANKYVISSTSFEYIPVTPAESSSGTYSGGSPVKNKPKTDLFQKAADMIQAAQMATADHADQRQKGTGQVEIRDGDKTSTFYLKMGSSSQQQIEAALAELKSSGS